MTLSLRVWGPLLAGAALSVGSFPCMAQQAQPPTVRKEQTTVDALRAAQANNDQTYYAFDHRYKGVRGTPYLLKSWQPADLRLQNNYVLKNVLIKYDLVGNNLLAVRSPGDSLILDSGLVKEFVLHDGAALPGASGADRTFRRYAFQYQHRLLDNYFEVLAEGRDLVLLKRIRKEIKHFTKEISTYSAQSGFDEIEDRTEYYVFSTTGSAQAVKLSRKGFDQALQALGAARPEVAGAGQNPVRTEPELVAAFRAVAPR